MVGEEYVEGSAMEDVRTGAGGEGGFSGYDHVRRISGLREKVNEAGRDQII